MSFDPDSDTAFTAAEAKPSRNYVKFYPKWKRNNFKSEQEGKEIGEYVDFIMIVCPGQDKQEWHGKVTDEHKREYPEQWRAYKEGREQRLTGTPIELLPGLGNGRADMYKAKYIHTIEQLAEMSDEVRGRIGLGGVEDMQRAKAYLQKNTAEVSALRAQIAERDQTITTMQTVLREMEERLSVLEAPKRPRGRPRKTNGAEVTPS